MSYQIVFIWISEKVTKCGVVCRYILKDMKHRLIRVRITLRYFAKFRPCAQLWTRRLIHHVFSRQIYKQKLYGSKYVWVINTPDKYGWWNRYFNGVNCTPEEVNKGANGILQVNYMWLSTSRRKTVSGTVRISVKWALRVLKINWCWRKRN